jgi:DNA polymerase-3 subunit gamma/tau
MLFTDEELNIKSEYKVLARKYRPKTFKDMVGQDTMVRIFTNAVSANRVAHAFLLTGIRGVGKTTTARIIARALNCLKGESIEPCGECDNCKAILEDRHQDVIEMDAASHTGVNDIREIIESSRYKPISARYKIFIIDEVHMLSNSAFNALLKTLEEPPAHVKFIFATTEIRKIPITILSRCQRFDLKRVDNEVLESHFANILTIEGVAFENDALKLVASVSGGSVRDGLSILDQAIVVSKDHIVVETVRQMLGLTDVNKIFNLYEGIVEGKAADALQSAKDLYDHGADPIIITQELLDINHRVTKAVIIPETLKELPEFEQQRLGNLANNLQVSILARLNTIMTKEIEVMKIAHNTFKAFEVMLIKLAYLANLPSLEELIANPSAGAARAEAALVPKTYKFTGLQEIVSLLLEHQEIRIAMQLRQDVAFEKIEGNKIYLKPLPGLPINFNSELAQTLKRITSQVFEVIKSESEGLSTIVEQKKQENSQYEKEVIEHDGVQEVLSSFTGIEIADITNKKII